MWLARGGAPYKVLRLSTSYRYDCFLQLIHQKKKVLLLVAEFKLLGESLLRDLESAKARYGQLHLEVVSKHKGTANTGVTSIGGRSEMQEFQQN